MLSPLIPVQASPVRVRDLHSLRDAIRAFRHKGLSIGFVPTMGALHEGHLALVRHAKTLSDVVVVSIFVNPKQFAPHEDFGRYPRQEEADAALLSTVGCDLIYLPTPELMYPEVFSTLVHVDGPSQGLESDFRPQFFDGVTTVVAKLFNQVQPDIAVFGEKDYQQLKVVQTFVRDLDMTVEVIGLPTLRDTDGLALSSRNAYLRPDERRIAAQLHAELNAIKSAIQKGDPAQTAIADASARLIDAGFARIDYIEHRDAETLSAPREGKPQRLLAAVWLGKTRLIDNIAA